MNSIPRLISYRDAPAYLGMDKNRFDKEVLPDMIEIPIGQIGVAFNRLDLDVWADEYKTREDRKSKKRKKTTCQRKPLVSQNEESFGTLTKSSIKVEDFTKALEQAVWKNQSVT